LRCTIEAHDLEPVLESRTSVALYRMVQESLNNAAKHAGASKVSIKLEWNDEVLVVEIADDGIGMGEAEMRKPGSFGLIGMRERANALGGSLIVNSAPGAGTRLQFSVPAPQTPASAGAAADQPA
jgi:two-component system sensor histidine kinase DegS